MDAILLIVDRQRGFAPDSVPDTLGRRIDALAESGAFAHVLATQYANYPGSPVMRLTGWDKLMTNGEQALTGAAARAEFVVHKTGYSGVTAELLEYLRTLGGGRLPEAVFLAGADTECCVLATALGLFEQGIRPIVLARYCGSAGGEDCHAAGLCSLGRMIGKNNITDEPVCDAGDPARLLRQAEDTAVNNMPVTPPEQTVRLLAARGWHISFAESCTGGLAAAALVGVPDASAVFDASAVTYANAAKMRLLQVREETIAACGVVSEAVAGEMACGAARLGGAEVGVGISGIAGPSGGSAEKPVGTVCFGFYLNGRLITETQHFGDRGRNTVRRLAVEHVYACLTDWLTP